MSTCYFGAKMNQAPEQPLVWTNLSRGFQGGFHASDEITVFQLGAERSTMTFCVKEFDSHEATETFYVLLCIIKDLRFDECLSQTNWCLGEDFFMAQHAIDFADHVVESYRRHGDLSRLPMKDLDHWAFNYL
jgi:hypothetical protein